MNLFDFIYERIWFPKEHKIRFFEAFSGIGCQLMALKRITDNFEVVGISEIDKYALQSYMAIHGEVKNYGGIGSFDRLPKDIDICTWSFPCTDISLAGQQKGMVDGTRSNYGYEFLNTVDRTPKGEKPKVLIMENVKALFSDKFKEDWREIQRRLDKLGYMSYAQVLNGKDYGVAQNRERIFIVSVMGEYNYVFPELKPLTKRLKDYLEDNVDKKYYLSEKMIAYISQSGTKDFKVDTTINLDVARPITTEQSKRAGTTNYISPTFPSNFQLNNLTKNKLLIKEATIKGYAVAHDGDGVYINRPHQKRGVVQHEMIQTIKTMPNDVGVVVGNKVHTMEFETVVKKRVNDVDLEKIKELLSVRKLTIKEISNILQVKETKVAHWFRKDNSFAIPDPEYWFKLKEILGIETDEFDKQVTEFEYLEGKYEKSNRVYGADGIAPTLTATTANEKITDHLKIRKLTPRECWRLMGISDEDFDKAQASGMSNAQLYKQAGNGIIVDVFEAILSQMIERNK